MIKESPNIKSLLFLAQIYYLFGFIMQLSFHYKALLGPINEFLVINLINQN